jgi:hypothetical protein
MPYVASGRFLSDLENLLGTALPREPLADVENDPLASFPAELRAELRALRSVWAIESLPKLCALTPGDFWPVPELTGEERDGTRPGCGGAPMTSRHAPSSATTTPSALFCM